MLTDAVLLLLVVLVVAVMWSVLTSDDCRCVNIDGSRRQSCTKLDDDDDDRRMTYKRTAGIHTCIHTEDLMKKSPDKKDQ